MSADTRTTWEGTVDCARCGGDAQISLEEQEWSVLCWCGESYTEAERAGMVKDAEAQMAREWNDPDRMTGGF